jgi:hypothetical protein
VIVVVDGAPGAMTDRMVRLADAALAGRRPGEIMLSRFVETEADPSLELGAGALPDLAAMAETVEMLKGFAAQSTVTTAPLRVLCRFTSASGADLITQVETLGAEVVVVSEDWMRRHREAVESLDAVTVLIVPAELPAVWLTSGGKAALGVSDGTVYVRDDGESDGSRAVVVGAAAAVRSGRALIGVVPDGDGRARRRLQQAFEPLRSRGTQARVVPIGELSAIADGDIDAAAHVLDRVGGSQVSLRDAVADLV